MPYSVHDLCDAFARAQYHVTAFRFAGKVTFFELASTVERDEALSGTRPLTVGSIAVKVLPYTGRHAFAFGQIRFACVISLNTFIFDTTVRPRWRMFSCNLWKNCLKALPTNALARIPLVVKLDQRCMIGSMNGVRCANNWLAAILSVDSFPSRR